MRLLNERELEQSSVVANCRMNRERNLRGNNGYQRDLRFDPLEFLAETASERGRITLGKPPLIRIMC